MFLVLCGEDPWSVIPATGTSEASRAGLHPQTAGGVGEAGGAGVHLEVLAAFHVTYSCTLTPMGDQLEPNERSCFWVSLGVAPLGLMLCALSWSPGSFPEQ